jgi:hypothetical protein
MRPDVAGAFDRLATAARRAGISLVITSAYRSDAEQARLFAEHPDPRWVAPPGTSLHRCATELDLGPSSAYAWLAANAPRFGFLKRYPWEPWQLGFARRSSATVRPRIRSRVVRCGHLGTDLRDVASVQKESLCGASSVGRRGVTPSRRA